MLIPVIIVLPLLAFWLWMFWDMTNNQDLPNDPALQLRWPPATKLEWTLVFVILNVVAAGYYYFTEYKND